MNFKIFSFILFLLFIASTNAKAECPIVSTDIEYVISAGYWQNENIDGRYRIIVVNRGFEHVFSQIFLEWIKTPTSNHDAEILYSVPILEINEPEIWSVSRPEYLFNSKQFKINTTNTYTHENKVFIVTPKHTGKYQLDELKE